MTSVIQTITPTLPERAELNAVALAPTIETLDAEQEREWRCPYCDSPDGRPVTKTWTEFQGCAEHGGYVELCEEMCTRCAGQAWDEYDQADQDYDLMVESEMEAPF